MKLGGNEREGVMFLLPLVALALVASIMMGGPEEALYAAERLLYNAFTTAVSWVRG